MTVYLVGAGPGDPALLTVKGMRDADARIASYYDRAKAPDAYRGEFYEGPHRFDGPMQEAAFTWLGAHLNAGAN